MTLSTAQTALEAVIGTFDAHPALTDIAAGRVRVTSGQLTEVESMALQVNPMHNRWVENSFGQLGHAVGRTNNIDTRGSTLLARVRGPMQFDVYPDVTLVNQAAKCLPLMAHVRAEGTLR
jgi:hypothetical protein